MHFIRSLLFDISIGMAPIIYIVIIFICTIIYIIKISDEEEYQIPFSIMQKLFIVIPVIAAIVLLCSYLIACILIRNTPYDYQEEKPADSIEYLVGLNDNSGVRGGKYYISRGYIESNIYYNYMVNCGSYMKQNQLNAITNDIRIIASSTETPRVEWRTKKKSYGLFYIDERYWVIYVPEDTINNTISIDMN